MKLSRADWLQLASLVGLATGLGVGAIALGDAISPLPSPRPAKDWFKAAGWFAAGGAASVGLAIGATALILKIEGRD